MASKDPSPLPSSIEKTDPDLHLLKALLQLPNLAENVDEQQFLQAALALLEGLTDSSISFLHFVNDDEESIELVTWSKRTLEQYCHASFDSHYPVTSAGIWADAIREHRPVIFNDYAQYAHKRGLPEGHAHLARLISVPVLNQGTVVMIAGVGNKATDYIDRDVKIMQLVCNEVWNIAKRKRILKALREQSQLFQATFHQAALGMAQLSSQGQLVLVNQQFCEITGYGANELKCLTHQDITHPADIVVDLELLKRLHEGYVRQGVTEKRYLRPNGDFVWVNAYFSLVHYEDGALAYVLLAIQDITARKQMEQELHCFNRELEQRIEKRTLELQSVNSLHQTILNSADYAIIATDGTGLIHTFNLAAERLLGYAAEEAIGHIVIDRFFDNTEMHHRAKERSQELGTPILPGFATLVVKARLGMASEEEWHYVHHDGRKIPVRLSINTLRNTDGTILGYLAIAKDITGEKQTEQQRQKLLTDLNQSVQELKQYNQDILLLNQINDFLQACQTLTEAFEFLPKLLSALFPDCNGSLFQLDSKQNIVHEIMSWGIQHTASHFAPDQCWGLRLCNPHLAGSASAKPPCAHLLNADSLITSLCIPLMAKGQQHGLLFISSTTVSLSLTKQQLAITLAKNISLCLANLELRTQLEFQSYRDPLTGLYNRRYWEEALQREVTLAQRRQGQLSIIMIDIDYFKQFNDTFGHRKGDKILQLMAHMLEEYCRRSDVVGRYGGEEFLVIMPDTTLEDAQKRAEELRQRFQRISLSAIATVMGQSHDPPKALTASFGVANLSSQLNSADTLLLAVDSALYQAKDNGRNCVVIYDDPVGG